jgi:hypothetical protein
MKIYYTQTMNGVHTKTTISIWSCSGLERKEGKKEKGDGTKGAGVEGAGVGWAVQSA